MTVLEPGIDDQTAILVGIGHICLQWALLEHNLLAVLSAIEAQSLDRAAIIFAGLDMRQRLCKAIDLADYHKIHPPLRKRLRDLRASIDKSKTVDHRNRAVHGVHKASDRPHSVVLTMPRIKGEARHQHWSVADLYILSRQIKAFGDEAWSIYSDYGAWKFGEHRPEDQFGEFVAARPSVWLKFKQNFSARRDHVRRYLYLLKHWS